MKNTVENIIGGIAGFLVFFFGSDKTIMNTVIALIILMCFDIFTGVVKSRKNKITSQKFEDGFMRKIMMLTCVSLCYFIDHYKLLNVGLSLESATATFFIVGEIISNLENFVDMGIQLPQPLMDILAKGQKGDSNAK